MRFGLGFGLNTHRGGGVVAAEAPANTVLPVITGDPSVGETLTASTGTWTGSPAPTYAYQWEADGVEISGATASTLLLIEDEEDTDITVVVTATNSEGSDDAESVAVGPVEAGSGNTIIILADEGVSAANTAAQNKDALFVVGTALRTADDDAHYEFRWPAGLIDMTDNRPFFGLRWQKHVAHASGTRIRSTNSNTAVTLRRPLWMGTFFQTNTVTYAGGPTYHTGYRFDSADAGDTQIVCTTVADGANFVAGERIFLGGYDQQRNGFPPNFRYFEWATVDAGGGDGGTGVVPLTAPLENDYNENWYDTANQLGTGGSIGKPRAYRLDRGANAGYWPVHTEFDGDFTFKEGTAANATGQFVFYGENVLADGITVEDVVYPTEAVLTTIRNSAVKQIENDKCGDTSVIENVDAVNYISGGTGYNQVTVTGGSTGSDMYIGARQNSIDGTAIGGNLVQTSIRCPSRLTIENLSFTGAASDRINCSPFTSMTISDVTGNNILVPNNGTLTVFTQVGKGMWIFKSDGSKGGRVSDLGIVNGSDYEIQFDEYFGSAPVAAETWFWSHQQLVDLGGHSTGGGRLWGVDSARWAGCAAPVDGAWECVWTSTNAISYTGPRTVPFYGQIDSITVDVTGAYGGADANHDLYLASSGASDLKINLKVVGTRVIDRVAVSVTGNQSGDSLAAANIPAWTTTQANKVWKSVGSYPTDMSSPAVFTVTTRWKDFQQINLPDPEASTADSTAETADDITLTADIAT